MPDLKVTDKLTELAQKIAEEHEFKIKSIESEITQVTDALIQDKVLLKHIDLNCFEEENLISHYNSKLS